MPVPSATAEHLFCAMCPREEVPSRTPGTAHWHRTSTGTGTGTAHLLSDQHECRVFDVLLDLDEELHRFPAIDDAVVVAQREVHHRPDDDLTA